MAHGRPVALVTGASRGIGKATAIDLAAAGFDVAAAARTAQDGRGRSDTDPGLALPGLVDRGGGTIVNLVSGAGRLQPPARVGEGGWSLGYAMSKAAFGRVAPVLHVEYAELGVRVFSVDPGWTVTERTVAAGRAT